jgi:hypothetical protein
VQKLGYIVIVKNCKLAAIRLIAAATATLMMASAPAQQTLHLTLQSPPGEWIGGGQNWDVLYTEANTEFFNVNLGQGGQPNYLTFSVMQTPVSTNYLTAQFGTNMLGQNLHTGVFLDAQRAPFAQPGHPGLDISFQHRGSNTLTGMFEILSVDYHQVGSNWILDHFDATFEQHSEGGPLALTGRITYAVPEPGTIASLGLGLIFVSRRMRNKSSGELAGGH